MNDDLHNMIRRHWAPKADLAFIRRQLERRGGGYKQLAAKDLASLDQLHAGQVASTALLVKWAHLGPDERVLDLGAGLGGTARYLAETGRCQVTALELSAELDTVGRELTAMLGLADDVTHCCGDVNAFNVDDHGFYDVVLLQHVDMHLPNKLEIYRRCRDFLKPNRHSRVLWHDWLAGGGGELLLPVPWAAEGEDISFLSTEDRFREDLNASGFQLTKFNTITDETTRWFEASRDALTRVLEKVEGKGRERFERLLAEVSGALENLEEHRLIPFFAQATRS